MVIDDDDFRIATVQGRLAAQLANYPAGVFPALVVDDHYRKCRPIEIAAVYVHRAPSRCAAVSE